MRPGLTYVAVVVAAGALTLWTSVAGLATHPAGWSWLLPAMIAWMSAPLALRVPGAQLTITVSESLSFLVAIAFGWQPAVLTVAVDGLIASLRQRNPRLDRTLFNIAEPAVSMAACGLVLDGLSGMSAAERLNAPLIALLVPGFAATSTYLLFNSALTSGALALETGASTFTTWQRHARWLLLDQMGATSLALLVVAGARGSGLVGMLAALPLLGALYMTYRSSIRRAEDALNYAERLNRVYLGTVESLATAIDAKDQVTHGHLTRVRTLALRLARSMGITDEVTLKALEAGALLHDVGKLGVPDHILNKPGPLTAGEYEQVKRHVTVGADIVSRVEYPYPVAPIVRHHHEHWDGHGYPDGLRYDAIPIGARILSVIDCYDALTSDRPYRQAMTHAEALKIVMERRGSMYDPDIVDAFAAMPAEMVTSLAPAEAPHLAPVVAMPRARETVALSVSGEDGHAAFPAVMAGVGAQLLELTPATTAALFVPGASGASLRLAWASGTLAADLASLTPAIGHGLSGWVAAHHEALLNACAELEFDGRCPASPLPRHALCIPVDLGTGRPTGTLTLYSDTEPFAPADQALVQALASTIAPCARRWMTVGRDAGATLDRVAATRTSPTAESLAS